MLYFVYSTSKRALTTILILYQLKGFSKDGSQHYKFTCRLSTMVKDANNFTTTLSHYCDDPERFVAELCKATDVTNEVGADHTSDFTSQVSKKRKRGKRFSKSDVLCSRAL